MHIGLKAAPPPQIRRPQRGGRPNRRAPPNGHCPPRWRRFLVKTATCGRGEGAAAGTGIAEAAPRCPKPPHRTKSQLATGCPPPYPARALGWGGGGGRQRGLCSRSPSAAAAARGPRPPLRPRLRPALQRSPQLRKGVVGRGPGGRQGPVRRNLAPEDRGRLWVERGARSFPCTPALRLPAADGLEAT